MGEGQFEYGPGQVSSIRMLSRLYQSSWVLYRIDVELPHKKIISAPQFCSPPLHLRNAAISVYTSRQQQMADYKNGKIYSLRSRSRLDLVYVGSTTQELSKRLAEHVGRFRRDGMSMAATSKFVLEIGDAYIELIEYCPCATKAELFRREGQLQRAIAGTVNRHIAGQTREEYRATHATEIAAYNEEYRATHATEEAANNKEYRTTHAAAISVRKKDRRAAQRLYNFIHS
jgi:hypothetical protein